jgi:alpha-L-rhamnosidase
MSACAALGATLLLATVVSAADASLVASSVVCRTQFHPAGEHVFGVPLTGARLSWRTDGTATAPAEHPRAELQLAYELEVSTGGDSPLFTSGKVASAEQQLELPESLALKPDTTYEWRVRTWLSGAPGTPTAWGCTGSAGTSPAAFDTAPATPMFPGKAAWVGGGGQLRAAKGLALPAGKVARARVWVSGMGAFYLFVNGEKVGINVMDPPQTVYSRTILFSTFDVAALLTPGKTNDIGALLGNYKWGYTDQVSVCNPSVMTYCDEIDMLHWYFTLKCYCWHVSGST